MPKTVSDRKDFTNRFNSRLTPEQESAFTQWMWNASQKLNRSLWRDLYDYDLRGFYASGGQLDGGHLPDTFKKPNHPTFSNESMYSGSNGYTGGTWQEGPDGKWLYVPSGTNVLMHGVSGLRDYFVSREPDSLLVLK